MSPATQPCLLRAQRQIRGNRNKRTLMNHLIVVHVIVVVLDITILSLEYAGLYDVQTAYKAFVYSIKLKIEFSILNKLVEMVQGSAGGGSYVRSQSDRGRLGGGGIGGGSDVRTGLRLEDMDGDGKENGARGGVGQSTFVAWADEGDGPRPTGKAVMMTREVIVRSDRVDRDTYSELAVDSESLDVADATTSLGFAAQGMEGRGSGRGLSSSEEHLARVTPTD